MGYLFLAVALLCGSTKGYCGKRASGLLQGYTGSTAGNLLRVSVCIVISFILVVTCGQHCFSKKKSHGDRCWVFP